jgi:hypothetical protein
MPVLFGFVKEKIVLFRFPKPCDRFAWKQVVVKVSDRLERDVILVGQVV